MANSLARETSPYLLQHADNPVDWRVWDADALALARREDKPILLSVGYSTCHWCHVMARESFSDAEIAAAMNRDFICIKVDREERPDLDQLYQHALHVLTGRAGGWPLTLFLTPDGVPFFGGTYFPPQPRYQLPGFPQVLAAVATAWRERRAEIQAGHAALLDAMARSVPQARMAARLDEAPLLRAVADLKRGYDAGHGGFGGTPKFPRPPELEFLFWSGDAQARAMVLLTLENMAARGLMDQLGGGFFRYSVDERWSIPHFEKMLYDNGPLLALYGDAWAVTGRAQFMRAAELLVGWLVREMTSPEGLFYSAQDADSEHEEGRFYLWTPAQVAALLSAQEYAVAAAVWGLDGAANFEQRAWHLQRVRTVEAVAQELAIDRTQAERLLESARERLFEARRLRVPPARDDKVLTAWNALMIRGLARAGRRCARADWIDLAARAARALHTRVWRDGRLAATWQGGRARHNGYLDDHAFFLDALLELAQADWHGDWLTWARALADTLLRDFEDAEAGGFYFTGHDHERLIQRIKNGYDQAMPSGNGVAARALGRLALLLDRPDYQAAARRCVALFMAELDAQPAAFPGLLGALREQLQPPRLVLLRGPDAGLCAWHGAVGRVADDATMVFALGAKAEAWEIPTSLRKPLGSTVNAYVCAGVNCLPEIVQLTDLLAIFSEPAVK